LGRSIEFKIRFPWSGFGYSIEVDEKLVDVSVRIPFWSAAYYTHRYEHAIAAFSGPPLFT